MSTFPKRDALYLTYDGLLEPIGQSQVIPYLTGLSKAGVRIEILSFEKPEDIASRDRIDSLEQRLSAHAITWNRLPYHHRPRVLSTAWDVLAGTWVAWRLLRASQARLVHARSYVPALMGLLVKALTGAKLLFDMRGFWPEERVELGIFPRSGLLYRITKRFERAFLSRSERIVVLTRRAKDALLTREDAPEPGFIEVIPCAVDFRRFSEARAATAIEKQYDLAGRLVIGNIGSASPRYLLREMFRFIRCLQTHHSAIRFVYLTRQDPRPLFEAAASEGVPRETLVIDSVGPETVPTWLAHFHFGLYFLRTGYAAQAVSNTKLGEFLASGVPVVTNRGVGDVEEILTGDTGVLLSGLTDRELDAAAAEVVKSVPVSTETRDRCRRTAQKYFNLEEGCARYLALYRSLLESPTTAALAIAPGAHQPL